MRLHGPGDDDQQARVEWGSRDGASSGLTALADPGPQSNGTVTEDWHVDEKLVGSWTTSRNLTYVKIFNSSRTGGLPLLAAG